MKFQTLHNMKKSVYLLSLLLMSFTLTSSILTPQVLPVSGAELTFYADVVKYPLPGLPEAVLDGSEFTVQVKMPSDVVWGNATVFNDLAGATATLLDAQYDAKNGLWNLRFDLPSGIREGAYSLTLEYTTSGATQAKTVTQLRCLWILPQWPEKLKILACGDVKPGAGGLPYWIEMAPEANLIDPDVVIFLGDLVNVPSVVSEWSSFKGPFEAFLDPLYMTAGNHEYQAPGDAKIYERIMAPVNYSTTIGDFLLLCLDTDLNGWVSMERLQWAEQVLKANSNKTKIMFFHYAFFNEEEIKPKGNAWFNISSWENVTAFLNEGMIFPTWAAHPEETKELFRLIIEYDVRLIMYEHIHTDLNVIVENTATGKKHYFICPAALAFDVPNYDRRGFKLVDIYANGTVDESTLYYNGTAMFSYPNSIPIDTGCTVNYQPIKPYKIGYLEYYYAPANDGQHNAVSFTVKNELNQDFKDPRIIFKLPADVPLENYRWHPYKPDYEAVTRNGIHYVILKGVTIHAHSTLFFTVESTDDTDNPTVSLLNVPGKVDPDSWIQFNVKASDYGWGVKEVSLTYSIDGETWSKAELMDLQTAKNGAVTYKAWIRAPNQDTTLIIKAEARDFAGHESVEAVQSITVGTPPPPKYSLNINSSPITGVTFTLEGESHATPYSVTLETGNYTISVSDKINVDKKTYEFVQWGDGVTSTTRTIKLEKDTTLTLEYKEVPPPETGVPLLQIAAVAAIVIAVVVAIAVLKMKKTS